VALEPPANQARTPVQKSEMPPASTPPTPSTPSPGFAPPTPPPMQSKPVQPSRMGNAIGRALVTDDDMVTRQILCSVLRENGVPFDEAVNGSEAIKYLKKEQYGLIFLDLLMPRIDGWGVLDFIRSKGVGHSKIYILTAFREQRLSAADQEIVQGMLFKPINQDEVGGILQKAATARAS
jgi:CheY-like chemotaxis protein